MSVFRSVGAAGTEAESRATAASSLTADLDYGSIVTGAAREFIDCLDSAGALATFFVGSAVAQRDPALVRDIQARGHEIACRGELDPARGPGLHNFLEGVRRGKSVLENLTGEPVCGYRALGCCLAGTDLWVLEVLAEEGFQYDSSISPECHHASRILAKWPKRPVRVRSAGGVILEAPQTPFRPAAAAPVVCYPLGKPVEAADSGFPAPVGGLRPPLPLPAYPLRPVRDLLAAPESDAACVIDLHPWGLAVRHSETSHMAALRRRFLSSRLNRWFGEGGVA
jgi:hypothetical protein